MFLIFRPTLPAPESDFALTPDESRHARARRLRAGDKIYAGDGVSRRIEASLVDERSARAGSVVTTVIEPGRILVTAVPEKVRWDWLVEKAVELGVTEIRPAEFQRSDRIRINKDRVARTILAAASQSRRFRLPTVAEPAPFAQVILNLDPSVTIVLHPEGESAPREGFSGMIVGPEGGLSPDELDVLKKAGFRFVSFGPRILRVETAALAALSLSFHA